MAKRNKVKKELYTINTFECDINKSKLINTVYFQEKQSALDNIKALFDKCYPHGFNCNDPEVLKACIESPSYNDHECYLQCFYTTARYCYSLRIETFED